jgi:phage terminase large subunit GpA-like protein
MWQRIPGRMAEALDSAVYALAARGLVGTSPSRRQDELRGHQPPPALPNVIRSKWLQQ